MLVIASARALVAYVINMIMIEIMLSHRWRVEVECTPRDRVYGVDLSGLWLNLIKGFT